MPGGSICSVASCKNNSKQKDQLKYFTFPKDPHILKEWIRKCYRKDKFNSKYKRICSKHFKLDDYEDEMQARLMGTQPKKLKNTAIPSLYLPSDKSKEHETISKRTERVQKKQQKLLVEQLITAETICKNDPLPHVQDSNYESIIDTNEGTIGKLERENVELKYKVLQYEKSEREMKEKLFELEKQLDEKRNKFEEEVKVAFKHFLTANQVDVLLKKKSKVRWNEEELGNAFTLRYFSKRCYIYLRQTLHYPLPGLSTLQHWAANINLRSGLLIDVLKVMEIASTTKTDLQKVTVLSFDEVKVSSMYEYDKKHNEVVGPHSYMQVIMARGLFDKWKQPVFIAFDQKMTKDLLNTVINSLHKINYNVVACVSDCGASNMGLWRDLNININNTFSTHPVTDKPIFFLADVPHLLKLLRNWFLDTGFTLGDGTTIKKKPVEKLIENSGTEISSCYKLSSLHVQCEKAQRQNVKLAAQLFSHTTSTALKHYLPGNDKNLAINVGNFMQLVNNWFDVLNSYTPSAKVPTKMPYGLHYSTQNEILEDMKTIVTNMRCIGKNSLQIFQKGIIISTTSVQNLFIYLRNEFNITYLLTHRLNQDCLENFFSQLRSRGGLHDHPAPLNALYRVRMILLGKEPGLVQTHSNTQLPVEVDSDNYIFTSVLNRAKLQNIKMFNTQLYDNSTATNTTTEDSDSSSSTSTISRSISPNKEMTENDGLMYIAGYLAKKKRNTHKYLGKYTYECEKSLHGYAIPQWLEHLSFGGLIQPSDKWLEQVQLMEKWFRKMHKDTFKEKETIVYKTENYISKKVDTENIPKDLIKLFCRKRIFIRMNFLNARKRIEQSLKRRYISMNRSGSNKYRKTVS